MLHNYFTFAFRNLTKRVGFSLINISGLALGVSSFLMILCYLDFETSYDDFLVDHANIYRVIRTAYQNDEPQQPMVATTYGVAPALESDLPGVALAVRTHNESTVVSYQDGPTHRKAFHENDILITDAAFFDMFSFPSHEGQLATALRDPNAIVVTTSIANKYFGSADPIGKSLTLAGGRMDGTYTVTAVIEDVPQNSHFSFNMVLPINNLLIRGQYKEDDGWGWNNFITYVQLRAGTSAQSETNALADFARRRLNPKWAESNIHFGLELEPLRDIHLHPGIRHDVVTVSPTTLYFFGAIAGLILMIAWINYVNLATARATERSREVGIKKTIGAVRGQLIYQFLFESALLNVIGIVVAVLLTIILLPKLGDFVGKELSFDLTDHRAWLILATLTIGGSLASGIYPAFVLSSFKISKTLRPENQRGPSLRKALIVFQVVSSFVLIAGTFTIYRQLGFMQSRDKGLQLDQMLVVAGPGNLVWHEAQRRLSSFKEQVLKISGVDGIATSASIPGREHNWGVNVRRTEAAADASRLGSAVWVDTDFIPTYKINLVAGRNFDPRIASDMRSVIVNEAAVKMFDLGTNDHAVGQRILLDRDTMTVLGVTSTYNWSSLKSDYTPFLLLPDTIQTIHASIHIRSGSIPDIIERVGKIFKEIMPDEPFEYSFLDETFNVQYKSEQVFGKLFVLFAGLAVAISCLGLLGLASFVTTQRLKEIGIRKVMGASVSNIAALPCSQFIVIVLFASLISIPLSWVGMNHWLQGFAFRVDLAWDMFAMPILLLSAVTLCAVGPIVVKGALTSPAQVLKSE